MPLTLAHLSDLHLGPLPQRSAWRHFRLKRVLGTLSWHLRRKDVHDLAVAEAMVNDIRKMQPTHVAFLGDLVNVAAHDEFPQAAAWLRKFGAPGWISMVPGNHDTYVHVPWSQGLKALEPYMAGEASLSGPYTTSYNQGAFPYVRFVRNMAVIGLTSAVPQSLFRAGGTLGEVQLNALGNLLRNLKQRGYYRAVLIHHPPLPGLNKARKALTDAAAFCDVVSREGAELVLHGHNHHDMLNWIESNGSRIPVVGVPSGSSRGTAKVKPATWNLYDITRTNGRWQTTATTRTWDESRQAFVETRKFPLS